MALRNKQRFLAKKSGKKVLKKLYINIYCCFTRSNYGRLFAYLCSISTSCLIIADAERKMYKCQPVE